MLLPIEVDARFCSPHWYMNLSQYRRYLRELCRWQKHQDWVTVLAEGCGDVQSLSITMDIPPLGETFTVQLKMTAAGAGTAVIVDPYLIAPDITHPNISSNGLICLPASQTDEDSEWTHSLVLMIWGVAELLVNPNFDDPVSSSGSSGVCCNLSEYLRQFSSRLEAEKI